MSAPLWGSNPRQDPVMPPRIRPSGSRVTCGVVLYMKGGSRGLDITGRNTGVAGGWRGSGTLYAVLRRSFPCP